MSFFFGGSDSVAPVLLKHFLSLEVWPLESGLYRSAAPLGEQEGDEVVDEGGVW